MKYRKFLQSLPDKGKKVTETVKQLKGLIAQKDKLEDTVAQFERLTVSQLVQRTQLHVLDSDDSDDNEVLSGANHQDTSADLHEQLSNSKHRKSMDTKSSSGTWDYESSATPPTYKLEVTGRLSFPLLYRLLSLGIHAFRWPISTDFQQNSRRVLGDELLFCWSLD